MLVRVLFFVLLSSAITYEVKADEVTCEDLATFARSVMGARQRGIPVEKLTSRPALVYYKDMILRAYSEPLFRSDSGKDRAISEFGNSIYVACEQAEKLGEQSRL